jgi:hypothetical protein
VFHRKQHFWLVRDVATGEGAHQLEVSWRLGPTLSPTSAKDYVFGTGSESLGLITAEGHGWSQSAQRGIWSPVYGRQERTMVVTFGKVAELPAEFVTLLLPNARERIGRLEKMGSNTRVCAYRYRRDTEEHWFFFAEPGKAWVTGDWGSDAYFLYSAYNRDQQHRSLIICGGSYADLRGRRVVTGDSLLDFIEVTETTGKTEFFSSDPQRVHIETTLEPVEEKLAEDDPRRIGV